MDSFLTRYKNALVLIAVVLVQTIALAVQVQRPLDGTPASAPDGHKTTLLRYWAVSVLVPFERLARGSSLDVHSVWSGYIGLRHAHQQNEALQQEIARLRLEQAASAEDAAQGRRLQTMLGFHEQYIASTVAAQVIGTSGSDRSRLVLLDKGYKEGLRSDQAVITPDGIVGKLRDVFDHTAQLLLIDDTTSGAGIIVEPSRIRGILRGTSGGKLQINNLTADARIQPGQRVVTSGGDMVFPRGLAVGVIESITPDPAHQPYTAITIKPAADLTRLDEVLVITATTSTLPAEAQQDAAQALASAEASKRASDELSARLPGIMDPDHAQNASPGSTPDATAKPEDNTIGGVPNFPNSGNPRVQPALHPDHYTPGAAPPASDLKPGAPN